MRQLPRTLIRRQAVGPAPVIDRRVVGSPVEIARFLTAAGLSGRLVSSSELRPMPAGDPRVYVAVRLCERPVEQVVTAARWRRRPGLVATVTATVVVVVSALGVALYLLVQAVIALMPYVIAGLVILAVLWLLAGRAGVCPGVHCPGCRHR